MSSSSETLKARQGESTARTLSPSGSSTVAPAIFGTKLESESRRLEVEGVGPAMFTVAILEFISSSNSMSERVA